MANHSFELQTNYIVCRSCNGRTLRNSAKDKLLAAGTRRGPQDRDGLVIAATPCGAREDVCSARPGKPRA